MPSGVAGRLAGGRARIHAASATRQTRPALDPSTRLLLDGYYADDTALLDRFTGVGWPRRR